MTGWSGQYYTFVWLFEATAPPYNCSRTSALVERSVEGLALRGRPFGVEAVMVPRRKFSGLRSIALGVGLLVWLAPVAARAGTITFNPAKAGGSNLNWSIGSNWLGGVAPNTGDDAYFTLFGSAGSQLTTTMYLGGPLNLASLTVSQEAAGQINLFILGSGGAAYSNPQMSLKSRIDSNTP